MLINKKKNTQIFQKIDKHFFELAISNFIHIEKINIKKYNNNEYNKNIKKL